MVRSPWMITVFIWTFCIAARTWTHSFWLSRELESLAMLTVSWMKPPANLSGIGAAAMARAAIAANIGVPPKACEHARSQAAYYTG
jgi:hypothetical protein